MDHIRSMDLGVPSCMGALQKDLLTARILVRTIEEYPDRISRSGLVFEISPRIGLIEPVEDYSTIAVLHRVIAFVNIEAVYAANVRAVGVVTSLRDLAPPGYAAIKNGIPVPTLI